MYSAYDIQALPWMGCPIRKSPEHSLFSDSPKLIAASHVLHRLSTPRHPPIALSSLTIKPSCLGKLLRTFSLLPDSLVKEHRDKSRKKILSNCRPQSSLTTGYCSGGGERIRTDDLLRAKQALFRLSYTPMEMVGLVGVEPTTSRLSGVRSNRD